MPALKELTHGTLESIMAKVGFSSITNNVVNNQVRPSFARLHHLAKIPNTLHRIAQIEDSFVNTAIAAKLFRWSLKYPDFLRYNITTAVKSE